MANDEAFFKALFSSEAPPSREITETRLLIQNDYLFFKILDSMQDLVRARRERNQNLFLMSIAPDISLDDLQSLLGNIEESYKECKEILTDFTSELQENKVSLAEDETSFEEAMKELTDGEELSPHLNFSKHSIKIQRYLIREEEELIEEYQDCVQELEDLATQVREIQLSRLNGLKKVEEWTTCPQCGIPIKTKHLARHEKKVHGLIWTTGEIRSVQKCVRLSGQVSAEKLVGKKCNIQKRSNIKKYNPKRKYVPSPKPMNNAEIEDLKRKNLEQMERIAKDRERMKRLRANGSGRLS